MKKLTKRGTITIVGSCLMLTSYVFLKPSKQTISIDGRELFKKLDQLEVTYDLDYLYESLYSYEDFLKEGLTNYHCTSKNIEFKADDLYDLEPKEVALKILHHDDKTELGQYTPLSEEKIDLLENAIQHAIFNCPAGKEKIFCHNLSELKVVEYKGKAGMQGQYLKEDKMIVLYSTEIEKGVSYMYPHQYEYTYQELLDQMITTVLEHELNHVIQDFCSCYPDTNLCFNNRTLWEGLAETDITSPNAYSDEREALNLLSYTFLFDEDYVPGYLNELLYNNDLKSLFDLFGANTKEKQKEVYYMLQSLNLSYLMRSEETTRELKTDFRTTLTKLFCKNLITYNEKNNLPLEEVIYFYKSFLQRCLSDLIYTSKEPCVTKFSIEYIHDMVEIQDAFITYCVDYYGLDYETVVQKLKNIDQEKDENIRTTEIIVPYITYKTLPKSKQNFLKEMKELSNQTNFQESTKFITETIEQKENHTFKKKR